MLPHVKPGGLYIIEDVETSYWNRSASIYGYKLHREPSAVEAMKAIIDHVNSEFSGKSHTEIQSITFAQNCIIIRKKDELDREFAHRTYRYRGTR